MPRKLAEMLRPVHRAESVEPGSDRLPELLDAWHQLHQRRRRLGCAHIGRRGQLVDVQGRQRRRALRRGDRLADLDPLEAGEGHDLAARSLLRRDPLQPVVDEELGDLRGLELLRGRPDVDPTRIGSTGASGGAQQTFYLTALRSGLAAAVPAATEGFFMNDLLVKTKSARKPSKSDWLLFFSFFIFPPSGLN